MHVVLYVFIKKKKSVFYEENQRDIYFSLKYTKMILKTFYVVKVLNEHLKLTLMQSVNGAFFHKITNIKKYKVQVQKHLEQDDKYYN